jgi:hypothetical protein
MLSERLHERSHIVIRRTAAIDAIHESRRVAYLARPGKDILIGSVDLARCSRNCDSQFVSTVRKLRLGRDFDDLVYD